MNTFNLVSKYVKENNITNITVSSNIWNNLVNYISNYYPDLDSEYYGNILFNELSDLNITYTFED